jgi:hypothetical protein
MNLEDIVLNVKKLGTEQKILYDRTHMYNLKVELTEIETRVLVTRAG